MVSVILARGKGEPVMLFEICEGYDAGHVFVSCNFLCTGIIEMRCRYESRHIWAVRLHAHQIKLWTGGIGRGICRGISIP